MNRLIARLQGYSCPISPRWHIPPHPQPRLQKFHSQNPLSRQKLRYNVAGPRYIVPGVTCCGEYYLWTPEEDGAFFSKGIVKENLIEYRSGGYHPVHLEDTLHGGRYKIVQKLDWGRDATIWMAEDRK